MNDTMSRSSFIRLMGAAVAASVLTLGGCSGIGEPPVQGSTSGQLPPPDGRTLISNTTATSPDAARGADASATVDAGDATYRGFTLDNVLHDAEAGDIHFNLHVPESYDGATPVALFITLPGYQGLYFQGVGENLATEDFAFTAQDYDPAMIICAPQLEDWGATSAAQTVALTRHLLRAYAIDPARVFIEGYSGGGETLSLVMEQAPELYRRALFCSSQWDGGLAPLIAARVPVYLVVGEDDEYYGSGPAREAASALAEGLRAAGASDAEVAQLVTLDVKDAAYFAAGGVTNQHGGGGTLFSHDDAIMGWLFG